MEGLCHHLLYLLEVYVEGLRAEGIADTDGDEKLHELVQQHEEREGLVGAAGEGEVDDHLEQHVEEGEERETDEHLVLAMCGGGARVDAEGAERHELRLEDAKVCEDRERNVRQHREVHGDHRYHRDDRLHL